MKAQLVDDIAAGGGGRALKCALSVRLVRSAESCCSCLFYIVVDGIVWLLENGVFGRIKIRAHFGHCGGCRA
jgi:hypothetical protein